MFYLGLQSESKKFQIALVKKEKGAVQIVHVRSLSQEENPLYLLKPLFQGKRCALVTGLESRDVVLRSLHLKLRSKREVLSTLPFQVENLLPYPAEEVILLPALYPGKEGETDVFLLATSNGALSSHLAEYASRNIDPDIVSCTPLALHRFAAHYYAEQTSMFICHFGESQSTFIAAQEGKLLSSHRKNFGMSDLKKDPTLFSQELMRVVAYLKKKNPSIGDILLTGAMDQREKVKALLAPHLSCLTEKNPHVMEHAIPIGLALDAALSDKQSAQFRREALLSKETVKMRKKNLTAFLAASLCFSLMTLIFGNAHLKKKENAVLRSIEAPKGAGLKQMVRTMEQSLSTKQRSQLDVPSIPTVSQFLQWLSTHPELQKGSSISHFRYSLVKAPRINAKRKEYAVKIDLELNASDARSASNFHRSLLQEKRLIDPRQKVKWSGDHNLYRATFFLKGGR
ncbi:MAG: hypothetical protein KR126chlam1_00496 [Chlamydiae bacterium]|nr:hypothetical protein [Chlamydiota bacterium]